MAPGPLDDQARIRDEARPLRLFSLRDGIWLAHRPGLARAGRMAACDPCAILAELDKRRLNPSPEGAPERL